MVSIPRALTHTATFALLLLGWKEENEPFQNTFLRIIPFSGTKIIFTLTSCSFTLICIPTLKWILTDNHPRDDSSQQLTGIQDPTLKFNCLCSWKLVPTNNKKLGEVTAFHTFISSTWCCSMCELSPVQATVTWTARAASCLTSSSAGILWPGGGQAMTTTCGRRRRCLHSSLSTFICSCCCSGGGISSTESPSPSPSAASSTRGIYNIPSWHNSLLCVGKT